ncbi:MAG: hypothetical protein EXR51_09585 [Dehalococcoidia bacterium]|nr:hypothetical protein [Dehalococcoidia bacterium]
MTVYLVVWALLAAGALAGLRFALTALESTTRVDERGFREAEDGLDAVTRCCRFDLLDWEVRRLARWGVLRLARPPAGQADGGEAAGRFFALNRTISRAQFELSRAETEAERQQALASVRQTEEEQAQLRPRVERSIHDAVARQLLAEGLVFDLPVLSDRVFPPLAFSLVHPPSVLVISPRNEIKLERTTVLRPDLPDDTGLGMEGQAETLGWSAIVEPTGGYSTYPTMVTQEATLEFVLQAVAHEWSHTYLFFRPLGNNYFSGRQLRTINETVANIVGREVARAALPRVAPPVPAAPPQPVPTPPAGAPRPPQFEFRAEMRQTRQEAERLLKDGKVEDAERYMEERRRLFVTQGYNIRRLNQAYFAFHGSYADSPGSIDPIGPQLESLFQRAGSLQAFVRMVEGISTYQDYVNIMATQGIDPSSPAPPRR